MRFGIIALFSIVALGNGCVEVAPAEADRYPGEAKPLVIQSYRAGLSTIHATNPNVQLSIDRDPVSTNGFVLVVEYPASTGNPAGRDVWLDAENMDWTSGRAISFEIKPEHAMRLSVSFQDRNRVAYTSWTELRAAEWQTVRIPFDQIRPNPYFQPPDAIRGVILDVSEVRRIGFAPQEQGAGRLNVGKIVLSD